MSKRTGRAAMALVGAALLAACAQAEPPPAFPYYSEEGGRVRDLADILSPATEAALTGTIQRAEAQYGQQLAVVTVDSLHGYDIADFSREYANAWGLGSADRNDGLMILVAPNERQVRVEVGLGLERTFPDEFAQTVVDGMVPHFRENDYDGGVTDAAKALIGRMARYPSRPANDNASATQDEAA